MELKTKRLTDPTHVSPTLVLKSDDRRDLNTIKALASESRVRILSELAEGLHSVGDLSRSLGLPLSTVSQHVKKLEACGLVHIEEKPGERGLQRICQRVYDRIVIDMPTHSEPSHEHPIWEFSWPVGAYSDANVTPTCGLTSEVGLIGLTDDPSSFYEPDHPSAQLIWFKSGYLEYRIPNRLPQSVRPRNLWLTMEICSEAPMYHPDWPSDITLWINDVELGSWTSPADFGDQRGLLNPSWWEDRNTQHGLLKGWRVTERGSFIDGIRLSDVTCDDLKLMKNRFISVRIGVKDDARHVGGINLFGQKFGNYEQDIVLRVEYI